MTILLAAMFLIVTVFSRGAGVSWGQGFWGLTALGILGGIGILWTAITVGAKYRNIELKKPIWISAVFAVTPYLVFLYIFYRVMAGVMVARNYPGEAGIIIAALLLIGGTAAVGYLLKGSGVIASATGHPKSLATALIIVALVMAGWGVLDFHFQKDQYFNPTSGVALVKFCDICDREFRGQKAEKYIFCPYDHHRLHVLTPENLQTLKENKRLPHETSLIDRLSQLRPRMGWTGTIFLMIFGTILTLIPRIRFAGIVIAGLALLNIVSLCFSGPNEMAKAKAKVGSYFLEMPDPPCTVDSVAGGVKVTFDATTSSIIHTGVVAGPGETIEFVSTVPTARGKYLWDPKVPREAWVGPNGASWTPRENASNPRQFPLPDSPIASVIGYVRGQPFFIGSYREVTFERGGEIKLGLNERQRVGCYGDNKGKISVSISSTS